MIYMYSIAERGRRIIKSTEPLLAPKKSTSARPLPSLSRVRSPLVDSSRAHPGRRPTFAEESRANATQPRENKSRTR